MRIFISYKRGVSPDEPLALALHEHLRHSHEVFIDQAMAVGTPWAERIDRELRQADVLLLLLSAEAVGSEMVVGEVETAQLLHKHRGRPRILCWRARLRRSPRRVCPNPNSAQRASKNSASSRIICMSIMMNILPVPASAVGPWCFTIASKDDLPTCDSPTSDRLEPLRNSTKMSRSNSSRSKKRLGSLIRPRSPKGLSRQGSFAARVKPSAAGGLALVGPGSGAAGAVAATAGARGWLGEGAGAGEEGLANAGGWGTDGGGGAAAAGTTVVDADGPASPLKPSQRRQVLQFS